jgi:hypothetical protein
MVSEIITDGVPRQDPPHDRGQRSDACSEQKMKVVRNQCPSIAACLGLSQNCSEAIEKIIPVGIAKKDLLPSDSTTDDMMECIRGIYPRLSGHRGFLSHSPQKSSNNIMYVPYPTHWETKAAVAPWVRPACRRSQLTRGSELMG